MLLVLIKAFLSFIAQLLKDKKTKLEVKTTIF